MFIEFHLIQKSQVVQETLDFFTPNKDGKGLQCPKNCTASKAQKRCCKNLVCTECKGQKCDQPFATSWSVKGDPFHHELHHHCVLEKCILSKYVQILRGCQTTQKSEMIIYFGWVMQEIHSELSRNEPCPVWLAQKIGACCPGHIQDYPSTYHESCAIVTHVLHRHASWSVAPSSASDKQTNHAKLVKWLDLPRSKNSKQSLHHPIQGVVLKLKNWKGPTQNNSHNKDCSHGPLFDSPCEELEAALSSEKVSFRQGFGWHGKVVKRVAFDYSKFKEVTPVTPSKGRGAIDALLIPRRICVLDLHQAQVFCWNMGRKNKQAPQSKVSWTLWTAKV